MKKVNGFLLAGAAAALMGSNALAVNPYDALNFGYQPADRFTYQGGENSNRSSRGTVYTDSVGNVYIGAWMYGDRIWGGGSNVLDHDGNIGGSWQAGMARLDTNGNVIWARYTEDLKDPGDGTTGQSYNYNLAIVESGPGTGIHSTGHVGHGVGAAPIAQRIGNNDPNFLHMDFDGGIIQSHMVGSDSAFVGIGTTDVWEPSSAVAVSPTTGEVFHFGYARGDRVAVGAYAGPPLSGGDYDPYVAKFSADGMTLLGGAQPGLAGVDNNARVFGGSVSDNGQYVVMLAYQNDDGGIVPGTAGSGTYGVYSGGTRDAVVGIYDAATMALVSSIQGLGQGAVAGSGDAFRDAAVGSDWTAGGNLIIGGYVGGGDGGQEHEAYLAEIDPTTGLEVWSTVIGAAEAGSIDYIDTVKVQADGSILAYGTTQGTMPGGAGTASGSDHFLAKYDSAGTLLWARNIGNPDGTNDDTGIAAWEDEFTAYIATNSREEANANSTGYTDPDGNEFALLGSIRATTLKVTLGDFTGDGAVDWNDYDQMKQAIDGGFVGDTYDWDTDGDSDGDDVAMMLSDVLDSVAGDWSMSGGYDVRDITRATELAFAGGSDREILDFDNNGVVENADVDTWLQTAATANGFTNPYRRGDINLDHDVDLDDGSVLVANFGTVGGMDWQDGDFNGDDAVDLNDGALLVASFGPDDGDTAGNGGQAVWTFDAVVNGLATQISVDSNGQALLITEALDGATLELVQQAVPFSAPQPGPGAQVGELLTSNFITGQELIDISVAAPGIYNFRARWNVLGGDEQSADFQIEFIPEPASLALLGLGGLLVLRRRRGA